MRLQRALRPEEATCNVAASPDARIALMVAAASHNFCQTDSECLFLFLWKFSQLQKGMTNATTRFNFDKEHNERHMRWPATATGAPVSALKKNTGQVQLHHYLHSSLRISSSFSELPLDVCFSSPAALYNPEYTSLNHLPCLRSRTWSWPATAKIKEIPVWPCQGAGKTLAPHSGVANGNGASHAEDASCKSIRNAHSSGVMSLHSLWN